MGIGNSLENKPYHQIMITLVSQGKETTELYSTSLLLFYIDEPYKQQICEGSTLYILKNVDEYIDHCIVLYLSTKTQGSFLTDFCSYNSQMNDLISCYTHRESYHQSLFSLWLQKSLIGEHLWPIYRIYSLNLMY